MKCDHAYCCLVCGADAGDEIAALKAQLADREARLKLAQDSWDYRSVMNNAGFVGVGPEDAALICDALDDNFATDLHTALSLAGWEIVNTGKGGKHTWHSIKKKEADDEVD